MPEFEGALVHNSDSPQPYLSVVVAARNDDHGGNLRGRMQVFVDAWINHCRRHGLDSELIIVEWNPPAERARLAQALRWPVDSGPCRVRIIQVPGEIHARYRHAAALPLYQMIAKNVGIRRARGQFILATNIDIVFSDEIMSFLASRRLEKGRMYRVDRTDVMGDVPVDGTLDEQLAYCGSHILRLCAREGVFRLTPDGLRENEPQDIVAPEAGIHFGAGWFPVERYDAAECFRYMERDAEAVADTPPGGGILAMDVEPGPGLGEPPYILQVVDEDGAQVAEWTIEGRATLKLAVPPAPGGRRRLRVIAPGGLYPIVHDPRILGFRFFRMAWSDWESKPPPAPEFSLLRATLQQCRTFITLVRSRGVKYSLGEAFRAASRLTRSHGGASPGAPATLSPTAEGEGAAVGTDSGTPAFRVLATRMSRPAVAPAPDDDAGRLWPAKVAVTRPPAVDWPATLARWKRQIADMGEPVCLHLYACGDFTLMAREHWLEVRGYAELDLFSMHLDSMLCYAAHHAGAREEVLTPEMRIFHIEHGTGSGWTPEGQDAMYTRIASVGLPSVAYEDLTGLIAQMRMLHAPVIFNSQEWGLAKIALPEEEPAVVAPATASRESA